MRRADILFSVLKVPVDAVMLVIAGIFTYLLRTQIFDAWRPVVFALELPLTRALALMVVVAPVFLLAFAVSGLYAMRMRITATHEALRVLVASSGATMALISFMFLRAELFNSRFLILGFWLVASLMVIVGRLIFHRVFQHLMARYGIGTQRALLIGNGEVANQLEEIISEDPSHGYKIVSRSNMYGVELVRLIVSQENINEILFAHPTASAEEAMPLIEWCHEQHITFRFVPTLSQILTVHHSMDTVGRIPLIELRRTALDGWGRVFKRIFDIIFSFLALIFIMPVGLLIAFAIKQETDGPIFVRLRRVSGVRRFSLVKFRSMVANAEELKPSLASFNERNDGPLFKMRDDPRITRVGKFIRRFRLDELPQFWNVLIGDISVVGPRPHQPDEIAKYSPGHRRVLAMKAGATGLAQISGSSDLPFDDEVRLDTFYMEHWSLRLDLQIVFRTVWHMLTDHSAV